jgi:transaldolase
MKIFLDAANTSDIQWAVSAGLIDGVTMNQALVSVEMSDVEPHAYLAEICRLVSGPVSAEVRAVDADAMYREGKELAKVSDNVVVKVPMIEEGLVALRRLSAEGVRVDTTLVFNAAQALLAAKAGATYVSPLLGMLDDIGEVGVDVLREIRQVFDRYSLECEIVAASLRHPIHFIESAKIGADAVSVPTAVLKTLLLHPLTDRGLDQFLSDWSKRKSRAYVAS